jgi:hypothetical protein
MLDPEVLSDEPNSAAKCIAMSRGVLVDENLGEIRHARRQSSAIERLRRHRDMRGRASATVMCRDIERGIRGARAQVDGARRIVDLRPGTRISEAVAGHAPGWPGQQIT